MSNDDELEALKQRLEELRLEHRDLDDAIDRMLEQSFIDQLQITRMKKRKLALKDAITRMESMLIPNILA